jgi:hypothetical protein
MKVEVSILQMSNLETNAVFLALEYLHITNRYVAYFAKRRIVKLVTLLHEHKNDLHVLHKKSLCVNEIHISNRSAS